MQTGIKGVNESTTATARLLTETMTAKLRLTKTELDSIASVAVADERTPEQVVNTIVHRSIHAEAEDAIGTSQKGKRLLAQLKREWDKVMDEDSKVADIKDDGTIEVTVTMDLDKNNYEAFRRTFDAASERLFFSNCMDGHLDEMNGDNPELIAEYLDYQNERLYGKRIR